MSNRVDISRRSLSCSVAAALVLMLTGCGFYTRIEVADRPAGGAGPDLDYLLLGYYAGEEPGTFIYVKGKSDSAVNWARMGHFAGEVRQACLSTDGRSLVVFYSDNVSIYRPHLAGGGVGAIREDRGGEGEGGKPKLEHEVLLTAPYDSRILAGAVLPSREKPEHDTICAVLRFSDETVFRILLPDGPDGGHGAEVMLKDFPDRPARTRVVILDDGSACVLVLPRDDDAGLLVYRFDIWNGGESAPLAGSPASFEKVRYFSAIAGMKGLLLLISPRSEEDKGVLELWALTPGGWKKEDDLHLKWRRFVFRFGIFDLHTDGDRLFVYATNTQEVAVQEHSQGGEWRLLGSVQTGIENLMEALFIMLMAAAVFLVVTGLLMAWRTVRGAPPAPIVMQHRAGVFARAAAFFFDIMLVLAVLHLTLSFHGEAEAQPESPLDMGVGGLLLNFMLYQGMVTFYFAVSEMILGRSIGKMFMGLVVVQSNGTRASAARLFARNILRFLDFLPALPVPFLPQAFPAFGALAVLALRGRQRPGDILAGTYVVESVAMQQQAGAPSSPIVLASKSPRRAQILRERGYPVVVISPEVEEPGPGRDESPGAYAMRLAKLKNAAVRAVHDFQYAAVVLTADTVVAVDDEILGKPRDRAHARDMLRTLASRPHRVITGICLSRVPENDYLTAWDSTLITLEMSDEAIDEYLMSGKWEGSAGAYSIEEKDPYVVKMEGSRSNVEGLPLEVFQELYLKMTRRDESE